MGFSILKDAAEFLREKDNRKRWLVIFLCLALVVTAGTIAVLAIPGHAMTNQTKVLNCPYRVHEHSQDCLDDEGDLICGEADYVVHLHNDDCYDSAGVLVCRLPEKAPHEHDASCYTDVKTLVCGLEENPGHVHGEGCFVREKGALTCTTEEHVHNDACYNREQVLTCSLEEQEHVHDDSCYTTSRDLTCGLEESEEHTHSDECYTETRTLTCDRTTEPHVHGPECYTVNETLICTIPEHTHGDKCYSWNETLICQIPEGEGAHTHTDACYEVTGQELSCGKLELHTHGDSCYDENGALICGETELLQHVHGEDCFDVIELTADEIAALNSSAKEPESTAPVSCYDEEGNLVCTIEEHSHDESCLSDDGSELVCGKEAHTHTAAPAAEEVFDKVYEDEAVRVTASYGSEAGLPAEAELRAALITPENAPDYDRYLAEAKTAMGTEDLSQAILYDIGFYLPDGTEVEPQAPVSVSIQFLNGEDVSGDTPLTVVHFGEDGKTELLDATSEGSSVSFETDSFSPFLTTALKNAFGFIRGSGDGAAAGSGSLRSFVSQVTIKDKDGNDADGTLYVGQDYEIHLKFAELGAQGKQFQPTEDLKLSYQLPSIFKVEPKVGMPLSVRIGDEDIQIGTYSISEEGLLTIELTEVGKKALDTSNNVELTFDMKGKAERVGDGEDGTVHFADTGKGFNFQVVDQPRVDLEKTGIFTENKDGSTHGEGGMLSAEGGKLKYSVKATVEHGQVDQAVVTDVLTPPQTKALDLEMEKDAAGQPAVTVTLKRANSEETVTLTAPDDFELKALEADPENPQDMAFQVVLKGEYGTLSEGDELLVSYNYAVNYVPGSTDVFWGNVLNEAALTGKMTVEDPATHKTEEKDFSEAQKSNVEIQVVPPGDGIIFKTQEFSEKDRTLHYTLYTLVPAGNWTPFYIQDDMVVEFGGERYNLTEFKEKGRVSNLTVSAVDVTDGSLGSWSDSTGEQRRQSLEELKAEAHELTGYDMYHVWNVSPDGYDPTSVENCIRLWNDNNLEIIFGEWTYGQQSLFGNWNYEKNRLIITEYDLDMSDALGKLSLVNTSDYASELEKEASEVLLAGIRNTVHMRFYGYNPGYAVFFNNADRMNKTGKLDKVDNTIEYTVTMNTTDTTVNKYFRDVNTDFWAAVNATGKTWDANDYYPQTMQAVFYDVLPDGWEYVEGSLTATAYNSWETYYPFKGNGYQNSPIIELEGGKKAISAPLVFFYNDNGAVENRGCYELFNTLSDSLVKLTFTYKLKASDQWLKENGAITEDTNIHNYAAIKDKNMTHWSAASDIPYFPARLTKVAEQVGNSNLLRFTLKVNPNGLDLHDLDYLVVTDTSTGIQIKTDSIKVKDEAGTELTPLGLITTDYPLGDSEWGLLPSEEGGQFKLMLPDRKALTVTYDALIPELGDNVPVSNTASIVGVDRASTGYEDVLKVSEVDGSGSGSVHALTVEKADSSDLNKKLPGAKFKFYIVRNKDSELSENATINGYSCHTEDDWEIVTDEKGAFKITGEMNWHLEPGNYYILVEEEAPAGYVKLDEPIVFYYGAKTGIDRETYPSAVFALPNGSLTVTNGAVSFELPHSGGMGTTIFYVVGSILVAAALVLLIVKKRMSKES